jgi:3-hydroxy-D-aspartate aldolase
LKVDVLSCGGTMSYKTAAEFPGVTEVQAGGYVFMDLNYRRAGIDFETSLTLLTRVVSRPRPDKAIIDAGLKAVSAQSSLPEVKGRPPGPVAKRRAWPSTREGPSRGPKVAERLELLPAHADTTTCLHDEYVLVRRGEVDGTVKVAARGMLQ